MIGTPGESAPIEVRLADGGHVIVAFADPPTRSVAGDAVAELVVRISGSEQELEDAIRSGAEALGLTCTCSASRHPTVIMVCRR